MYSGITAFLNFVHGLVLQTEDNILETGIFSVLSGKVVCTYWAGSLRMNLIY
jgi:hypothetical protein